jgi:hypothetical protein
MIDVGWLQAQAEDAHCRAEAMNTTMRAAQDRLSARADHAGRAVEHAAVRRAEGSVPAVEEGDPSDWTLWIAGRDDRG